MRAPTRDYVLARLTQLGRIGPDSTDGIGVEEMRQAFLEAPPDVKWSKVFRDVIIRHRRAAHVSKKLAEISAKKEE